MSVGPVICAVRPVMPSSSDSDNDRRLPMAYRSRKKRASSSSSKTYSDSTDDERRRRRATRRKKQRRRPKKDKPMWKEEGEISDDGETSYSSKSSRSRSRSQERTRRRTRTFSEAKRHEERWMRSETTVERNYRCKECGWKNVSLKGLIHHQMNEHGLDAQCHYCLKKFKTKDEFREHHEAEHSQEVVKCIFCKSAFREPPNMDDKKWNDLFSHIYGEILYSRLADYAEGEGATENVR